ncbi:MAG TPA: nucleotide pyrophosphohydrolase [Candidatus Saccharimonadales bacterium]|nr:nucleotide pyrophosphohydrolase [Candidatus Saccharimonadales bacterium]
MKKVDKTDIDELQEAILKFVSERDWDKFQDLKSLGISLSLESNEFLEHFQWLSDKEVKTVKNDPRKKQELVEELSDILSYLLIAASKLEMDISKEFLNKLEKNRKKYPLENFSKKLSRSKDNKIYQKLRKEWMSKGNK